MTSFNDNYPHISVYLASMQQGQYTAQHWHLSKFINFYQTILAKSLTKKDGFRSEIFCTRFAYILKSIILKFSFQGSEYHYGHNKNFWTEIFYPG